MNQKVASYIRIAVWIFSLILCLTAGRTIADLWRRRDIVRIRQSELSKLRDQNISLERSLTEMKSDAYVEKIARDKLGLVKDGETMVILPERTGIAGGSMGEDANKPNWRRWVGLFF